MAVALCMKNGSQVAAPDLLTPLHLYAQECTERKKREQKGVQEHARCFLFASIGGKIQPHALNPKVHECINTRLCFFCAMQISWLQLACSPLAHFSIETQMCVCV